MSDDYAQKVAYLQAMGFTNLDAANLELILRNQGGDIDKAIDELLTITASLRVSKVNPSVIDVPAPRPAEIQSDTKDEEIAQLKGFAIEAQGTQNTNELPAAKSVDLMVGLDNRWPQFSVYRLSDSLTAQNLEVINKILQILREHNAEVQEVDISNDYELAALIRAKCASKGMQFYPPFVFYRDSPLGSLQELSEMAKSGELKNIIDSDKIRVGGMKHAGSLPSPYPSSLPQGVPASAPTAELSSNSIDKPTHDNSDDPALQLNFFDNVMNVAEKLGSILNPLGWFSSSTAAAPTADGAIDIDVIQSNWYWRHQRRKLRFGDDFFVRLHPERMETRAQHKIEDVAKITVVDANNIVIYYKAFSSPDFIRATAKDIKRIVDIITQRHPNKDGSFVVENSHLIRSM